MDSAGREEAAGLDIEWSVALPRAERIRVRAFTNGPGDVWYELCAAGGLMFVRRFTRRGGRTIVHESTWTQAREAHELWASIVANEETSDPP